MSNARIEEVSDSDPEIDDPSDFAPGEVFRPANALTPSSTASTTTTNPTLTRPPPPHSQQQQSSSSYREPTESEVLAKRAEIKPYCTLYPIYFSSTRTRATGRRVNQSVAISNPLAFSILKAVRVAVGPSLKVAFEPEKTHPKDWSNPGRVKVQLFHPDTHAPLHPTIRNKQHLYNLVAEELCAHGPTTKEDTLELKIQGLPVPENFMDTPVAVPRGWGRKMGDVLPVHSAAVSGGGVSDNFFKDAMEEMKMMQAAQGGAGATGPGGMDPTQMMQMMQSMGGAGGMGGAGAGGVGGGGKKKDKKKG